MIYRFVINKKGAEKIFSIWWLLVLAIIGVGIIGGVLIYYSADVDVREIEAKILYEKILECVSEQNFLKSEVFDENYDIFESCYLRKSLFEEENDFYFKIDIFQNSQIKKSFSGGGSGFEKDCGIVRENEKGEKIKGKHFPICLDKEEILFFINEKGEIEQLSLEILTASNQIGEEFSEI